MKVLNTSIFLRANDRTEEKPVSVLYDYRDRSVLKIIGVYTKGMKDITSLVNFFPEIENALELEIIENEY